MKLDDTDAKCNTYNTKERHIDCRSYPTYCVPAVVRLSARRLEPVLCIAADTLQTRSSEQTAEHTLLPVITVQPTYANYINNGVS